MTAHVDTKTIHMEKKKENDLEAILIWKVLGLVSPILFAQLKTEQSWNPECATKSELQPQN